ncbi:MAG: hypothetical protein K0R53_2017, partial [Burkholderiales bacterium]|nr:hypothetical protein [Burkholderiales bacterium]
GSSCKRRRRLPLARGSLSLLSLSIRQSSHVFTVFPIVAPDSAGSLILINPGHKAMLMTIVRHHPLGILGRFATA